MEHIQTIEQTIIELAESIKNEGLVREESDARVEEIERLASAASILAEAKIDEEKSKLLSEANDLVEVLKEIGGEMLGDVLGKKDEFLVDVDALDNKSGADIEEIAAQLVSMFRNK